MYFEAELRGKKYKVDVIEGRHNWKVSLQLEGTEWKHYDISKNDFRNAEEYISFLFEGKSYLIDVVGEDTDYTVFTRNSFRTIQIFNDEMLLHRSLSLIADQSNRLPYSVGSGFSSQRLMTVLILCFWIASRKPLALRQPLR